MPNNWSIGNSNGMLYYYDQQTKTTTYDDPRIEIRKKLIQRHKLLCERQEVRRKHVNKGRTIIIGVFPLVFSLH